MPYMVVLILLTAVTGLTVSLVLKYCDALVKGFATSLSVLLATAASVVLFDFEATRAFGVGVAVVCAACHLYFNVE